MIKRVTITLPVLFAAFLAAFISPNVGSAAPNIPPYGYVYSDCWNYNLPDSQVIETFFEPYDITWTCGSIRHMNASGHTVNYYTASCLDRVLASATKGQAAEPSYWDFHLTVNSLTAHVIVGKGYSIHPNEIVTAYLNPDYGWSQCAN